MAKNKLSEGILITRKEIRILANTNRAVALLKSARATINQVRAMKLKESFSDDEQEKLSAIDEQLQTITRQLCAMENKEVWHVSSSSSD